VKYLQVSGMLILLTVVLSSHLFAKEPNDATLHVISQSDQAIVFELTVADFSVQQDDTGYQQIIIANARQTEQADQPIVPVFSELIGLPTSQSASIEILTADYTTIKGYNLAIAPRIKALGESPLQGIAQTVTPHRPNRFYPSQVAEIGQIGYLRDQAVAPVRLYPIQYNAATGELRHYQRLVVRLSWDEPTIAATNHPPTHSPFYEAMLSQTIFNYDSLNRSTSNTPPSTTSIVPQQTAENRLKIKVNQDGIYKLTRQDITSAGFDVANVDARNLQLTNQAQEIAIYLAGEADGSFDDGDYILFYGRAITDIYTSENVYWLSAGTQAGKRMAMMDGSGTASQATSFPATVRAEQDKFYWQTMPNGEGEDHWFWNDRLNLGQGRDYTITLNNIATDAVTTAVRVYLKGFTDDVTVENDHNAMIYLNGVALDNGQMWDGQAIHIYTATVAHSQLQEGDNIIRVEAQQAEATLSQFFVNWIELDYWDTFVAENNQLWFKSPTMAPTQFEITNFEHATIKLFDITDPVNVRLVNNTTIITNNTTFTLQATTQPMTTSQYLALTADQYQTPVSLILDTPSNWTGFTGADYVIITHQDFYTSMLSLADYRQAQGMQVATIKITDIYDEFNGGVFSPQAIRNFLAYSYKNWNPAPTYVLLVGDASHDYKDNLNTGQKNYVPTQMIETSNLGQTPSDNWFLRFQDDDSWPEMFLGRLAVQTVAEADTVIAKVKAYEENLTVADWKTHVLLVADDGKQGDGDTSFTELSDILNGKLPFYYTTTKVYAADYPPNNPTTDITDAINNGTLMVNYAGHGGINIWGKWNGDDEFIFRQDNIPTLNNGNKLPLVTVANCLNGYFAAPSSVSMAEEFMHQADKGAIAVWAPTGLDHPEGHQALMEAFYNTIYQQDIYGLGAATTAAKIEIAAQNEFWNELVDTFILFGDPAMKIGVSNNYPYLTTAFPADGSPDVSPTTSILAVFNKPIVTSTVQLSSTANITFTPSWNDQRTTVLFSHPPFEAGTEVIVTLTGSDTLGQSLGEGIVPRSWRFTVSDSVEQAVYLPMVIK